MKIKSTLRQVAAPLFDMPNRSLIASRSALGGKQLLIACFPKSGSTYISAKIARFPGWSRGNFVPAYGRRDQELEEAAIARSLLGAFKLRQNIVVQHHCRASEHSIGLINKYKIKVVVLTRSLMDVALSVGDHWDQESVVGPTAYLNEKMLGRLDRSRVSRLQFIVQHVLPWYVSFYLSWIECCNEVRDGCVFVAYDSFFSDKSSGIKEILQFAGDSRDDGQVAAIVSSQDETRLNKGVPGRGVHAFRDDPNAYGKIVDLLACYPDVDFSPIFTPLHTAQQKFGS